MDLGIRERIGIALHPASGKHRSHSRAAKDKIWPKEQMEGLLTLKS